MRPSLPSLPLLSRVPRAITLGLTLVAGCVDGGPAPSSLPNVPSRAVVSVTPATPSVVADPPTAAVAHQTWYLDAGSERWTLSLDGASGTLSVEDSALPPERVDDVMRGSDGTLAFRRSGATRWDWCRGLDVEGVLVARCARTQPGADRPTDGPLYDRHVRGWQEERFSDVTPRAYDVLLDGQEHALIRLGRAAGGALVGTYKVYATVAGGSVDEQPLVEAQVMAWNGRTLELRVPTSTGLRRIHALASGRHLTGTFSDDGVGVGRPLAGARSQILLFGLTQRGDLDQERWASLTRRRIAHLIAAGAPAPLELRVTALRSSLPPMPSLNPPPDRDDDAASWPQAYHVTELALESTLPDGYGGTLVRKSHAFLSVPDAPGPHAAVVVLNGHGGSAAATLDPDHPLYWYGDSWARRGYVVLAVDVGHRPMADRAALYGDVPVGDDAPNGNGTHPAIALPGMDSDWEEDGERAWDAMRAVDVLRSRNDVDASRIAVTGLSMGGEIATLTGALDTRIGATVPAGFSPDLGVLLTHGNHPCWRWQHADVREYYGVSDLHALVAPRGLIVETGKADRLFSFRPEPFAADKQVLRRSRRAFHDQSRIVHYLHYDAHHYHVGDRSPTRPAEGLELPTQIEPSPDGSPAWQDSDTTVPMGQTIFGMVTGLLGG